MAYDFSVFGINDTFSRLRLSDFHDEAVADQVGNYIDNYPEFRSANKGLTLLGVPGSGKTMLVSIILKNIIVKYNVTGFIVAFDRACELMGDAHKTEQAKDLRDKMLFNCQFLVLDNIYAVQHKSWFLEEYLPTILRRRLDAGKVVFVTTSLSRAQTRRFFGAETSSLLSELTIEVQLPDIDFRSTNGTSANLLKLLKGKKST